MNRRIFYSIIIKCKNGNLDLLEDFNASNDNEAYLYFLKQIENEIFEIKEGQILGLIKYYCIRNDVINATTLCYYPHDLSLAV